MSVIRVQHGTRNWFTAQMVGTTMIRYNLEAVYDLGRLVQAKDHFDEHASNQQLDPFLTELEKLLCNLSSSSLQLSAATKLSISDLRNTLQYILIGSHNDPFCVHMSQIIGELKEVERTFKDDILSQEIYVIPPICVYDTRKLMEESELLLAKSARKKMEQYPLAFADFKESWRLLACGFWTPSGFHMARATERLFKSYYQLLRGKPAKRMTWGNICLDLSGGTAKNPTTPMGDQRLIASLKELVDNYRNPLIHPEDVLGEDEIDLFLQACRTVIVRLLNLI